MRIQQGTAEVGQYYQAGDVRGNASKEVLENDNEKTAKKDSSGLSIQGSELNLLQDGVEERKAKARAQAMDVILSQFDADNRIEENLNERRQKIEDSKKSILEAQKEINQLTDQQKKLKEDLGIADDSQEQKDLELRLKYRDALKPNSDVTLTAEEWEQYQNLGPLTDYQSQMLEFEDMKGEWVKQREEGIRNIALQSAVIRNTKLEMLKYHGMVDAEKTADKIMEASSKEIIGFVIQQGMEKVDQDLEDAVEKGKELKEEKEEQEALREEKKAEQKKQQQSMDQMSDTAAIQSEVEVQIQEILAKQKLLEEDLKGLQIDHMG